MADNQKIDDTVDAKIDAKLADSGAIPHRGEAMDTAENRASRTSAEQDRHSLAQRQINRVWEYSQAVIAITVVSTTAIGVFVGRVFVGLETQPFPAEWWTIVGLVIGFYFGRTNHARIGDEHGKQFGVNRVDDR